MIKSKVIQWGNSLAIKLPKSARDLVDFEKDDNLCIYITNKKELIIKKSDDISYDTYEAGKIINN